MPKVFKIIRTTRRSGTTTINLAKRRAWFADDPAGDQQNNQQGESKYKPESLEAAQKIIDALEKRIGERDATIKQLQASTADLGQQIKAIQVANQKKLEEEGNFAELKTQLQAQIATLQPSADRAAALEKIIRESNEARIKNVPEQVRSMIPTDYAPERLQAWLSANESLLAKQPSPSFNAGEGAGSSGGKGGEVKVTEADKQQAATAQALGHKVTAEDIAKRRAATTTAATDEK